MVDGRVDRPWALAAIIFVSQIVSKGCGDRKHLLLVDLHACYLTDLDLTSVHHLCVIYHIYATYIHIKPTLVT